MYVCVISPLETTPRVSEPSAKLRPYERIVLPFVSGRPSSRSFMRVHCSSSSSLQNKDDS